MILSVTAASEQKRAQVAWRIGRAGPKATGQNLKLAYGGQGYTGEQAAVDVQARDIRLEVVKRGFG